MLSSYRASHEAWLQGAVEADWLRALRERALAGFEAHGFPSKKVEAWKYSSTAKLARTPWVHDHGALFEALAGGLVGEHGLRGAAAELVFVNGAYAAGLSRIGELPAGVDIQPLHRVLADENVGSRLDPANWPALPDAARTTLGPYRLNGGGVASDASAASRPESAFDLLNTAFLQDGVVVRVDKGVELSAPVHVVLVTLGEGAPIATHPRLLLDLGAHAGLTVVERHVGSGDEPSLVNAVTDAIVGPGARLTHHLWRLAGPNTTHVGHVRVQVGRDARFESHVAWLGGSWSRNDLDVRFTGPGGEAVCTGVTLAAGSEHVDHHTWLRHEAAHCASRETYKGVYGGRSRGIFNGMVYIAKDAQHTDADLGSRNVLLSDKAQVMAKPELEIHADDVKAAHGCTVGQLDATQLAYLRTRGVDADLARRMLTEGFVVDLLGEISDESLREASAELVRARLRDVLGTDAANGEDA